MGSESLSLTIKIRIPLNCGLILDCGFGEECGAGREEAKGSECNDPYICQTCILENG